MSLRVSVSVPTDAVVKLDIPDKSTQREFLSSLWESETFRRDFGAICHNSTPDEYAVRIVTGEYIRLVDDDEHPIVLQNSIDKAEKTQSKIDIVKRPAMHSLDIAISSMCHMDGEKKKTYRKRFLVLDETSLYYYRNEKEAVPEKQLGSIDYHKGRIFLLTKVPRKKAPTKHALKLQFDDREIFFFFGSEEEVSTWSDRIAFGKWASINQNQYQFMLKERDTASAKKRRISVPVDILKDRFKATIPKLPDIDNGCSSAYLIYNALNHWDFKNDAFFTLSVLAEISSAVKEESDSVQNQLFWVAFSQFLILIMEKEHEGEFNAISEDESHILFRMRQKKFRPGDEILQHMYDKTRFWLCQCFENVVVLLREQFLKYFFQAFFNPSAASSMVTVISQLDDFHHAICSVSLSYDIIVSFWAQIFHIIDNLVLTNVREHAVVINTSSKGHLIKRNISLLGGFLQKYEGDIFREKVDVEEAFPIACAIRDIVITPQDEVKQKIVEGKFKPLSDDDANYFASLVDAKSMADFGNSALNVEALKKLRDAPAVMAVVDVFVHLSSETLSNFRTRVADTPPKEMLDLLGEGFNFLLPDDN